MEFLCWDSAGRVGRPGLIQPGKGSQGRSEFGVSIKATRPHVQIFARLVLLGSLEKTGMALGCQSFNSDIPWTHRKRRDLSAREGQGFSPFSWWDMDVPARPPAPILVYSRSFCSLLPSVPVLWILWDGAVPGQDYFPWITDSISMRNCCWSPGDKCSCSS